MANKKIEEKNNNGYVPKKTNRGLIALLIIGAVIMILVTVVLPIVFTIFVLFLAVEQTEFEVIDDNTINITNVGIEVMVEESKYDEENNCYVLFTKTEVKDRDKYKKSKFLSDTMNVTYSFIDTDGYVVGSETLFIESLDKYDKYKQTVSFCGEYAGSVESFEVESVDNY